jgi:hypothetical protein
MSVVAFVRSSGIRPQSRRRYQVGSTTPTNFSAGTGEAIQVVVDVA